MFLPARLRLPADDPLDPSRLFVLYSEEAMRRTEVPLWPPFRARTMAFVGFLNLELLPDDTGPR